MKNNMLIISIGVVAVLTACTGNKGAEKYETIVKETVYVQQAPDSLPASTKEDVVFKPVTQYHLVASDKNGASLRDYAQMAKILKGLGFKVTTHKRPNSMDEMEEYTVLNATREGSAGITKIKYTMGEDHLITIDFANKDEVGAFIESMEKAKYRKNGTLYENPKNRDGVFGEVLVRVSGSRVKIIDPFEMAPNDF